MPSATLRFGWVPTALRFVDTFRRLLFVGSLFAQRLLSRGYLGEESALVRFRNGGEPVGRCAGIRA